MDDEIQMLKREPLHARILFAREGAKGYTSPNFVVIQNSMLISWESNPNANYLIKFFTANGDLISDSTSNRGQKKLDKAGTYYVAISSTGRWRIQVDRLDGK
jgi:hypothetical protein